MNGVLTRLNRALADPSSSDAQLLDTFLAEHSEPAFRELVARHGSLVFGVCNRVLRHRQDAEDAFQAVFLVLARRAADVWPREALGSWLHGVAHRVALKARALRARRRVCEQPLGEQMPTSPAIAGTVDLAELIDAAVRKLPEVYRAAVVACDLEGLSRAEAASRLGWKEGTLSGRLARARKLLADRLRRAGVTLPTGGVGAVLGTESVAAEVVADTVRVAIGCGGGNLAVGVSGSVAVLTEGVVQAMFLAKLKATAVAVLAVGVLGMGVWAATGAGAGQGSGNTPGHQPNPTAKGKQPALDLDVARGNLDLAWKELDRTLQWQEDWIKRGQRSIETPEELAREIGRFRSDIERLQRLLNSSQRALDAAKAAGPGVKIPGDLARMQGRWRIDTLGDGKNQTPLRVSDATVVEVIGNKWYMYSPRMKRAEAVPRTIELRPDKKPAELDLIPPADEPPVRCIYRFAAETDPRPGNLWVVFPDDATDPRPTEFTTQFRIAQVAEFTRVIEPADGKDMIEGVDLRVPRLRRELFRRELEVLLQEDEIETPPTTLEQFENQLQRKKARLAAAERLLDEAQKEVEKEKARAKDQPKPPGNLIDDAKARREIERQRAAVVLEAAMREAALAQKEHEDATVRATAAALKNAEARRKLAAAKKALDDLTARQTPAVEVTCTVYIRPVFTPETAHWVKPGGSATVRDAIAEVKDQVKVSANTVTVWVLRDKEVLPVDLAAIERGDTKTNHRLQNGDSVFIRVKK